MLKNFVRIFGGDPNKRAIEKFTGVVEQINALEPEYEALSDEALKAKTAEFRSLLVEQLDGITDEQERKRYEQEALEEVLPEAFAAVREASKRTIGLRHYDVQLIGGIALHQSKIAEMRTGEGKTLVATLPLYLNALTGRGVHLVTVNDYLARRDARWMAPIYNALGLSVGVLQMAARTENGRKAFIVDLERESPHEDQHQLRMVPRREAYESDIIYGTNSEFGFDYLRDNMTMSLEERVQRGHYFAIVDEVDNVLIDEARTPLIISGPATDDTEWYVRMAQVVRKLRPEDYEISERDRTVTLSELGEAHVEELLEMPLRDPNRPEDVTPEQARLMGYLEQALRAQFLFRRNKDYLVQAGKVIIVDEFTGRLMPGRRWSDGLHQAVEAKEGVRVEAENVTYATITIQNYFRMYQKLAGMTGTAVTEAEEFDKIYKLDVVAIPTNLEYIASRPDTDLVELEDKDDQGYRYHYYARPDDSSRVPVFWRRKDYPDVIYRTEEAKFRAQIMEILGNYAKGRPMLVGTTSVELSERLSSRLRAEPLRRLAQVMLIRQVWMNKHDYVEDGRQISELQPLTGRLDQIQTSDLRKMAQELGVSLNPEDPGNLKVLMEMLHLEPEDEERLLSAFKAGIPHEVLNARKHTEESQIIAGAGAFGALTIATNMAGRGVDIKLGGELAEEIISSVNRVLRKAGYPDPFDMPMEERRKALLSMDPQDFGIYEAEIQFFLQHMDDMERVKSLGGLHVIGSERHEARRIDNQLRGRAARQGDPGSSRFYLSLEDELMVRFGGQQANDMMQRLKVDDALPIEIGLVGRLVEQSQTRVEGANFDIRKHLLEYDDVLNTQRTKIYEQRNRIFVKDDLSEDVTDMLRTEVLRRVPEALKDEEGPWQLLAWLEQVQPPLVLNGAVFPSYTLKLILDQVGLNESSGTEPAASIGQLLGIAQNSLNAEAEHILRTVRELLDQTQDRLESQRKERMETLDTFFEGLNLDEQEGEEPPRTPREAIDELSGLLRFPVKLSPEQLRLLKTDPDQVKEELRLQLDAMLESQAAVRLIGATERRLEESLELNPTQLPVNDWNTLADQVMSAVETVLARRRERLVGAEAPATGPAGDGQIAREMENALARTTGPLTPEQFLGLLLVMPQGARAMYDKKTHRRVWQRTNRLTYIFYAARFLYNRDPDEIAEEVLEHLENAQAAIRHTWGISEWSRLAVTPIKELAPQVQADLRRVIGEDKVLAMQEQTLQNLSGEDAAIVVDELGRRALTEIYRQLLLGVITELWVDYLTQMEALRVSIGLEAYAQRDPLVQYKSRAFELFQTLLANMRLGVISRMFTFQPRLQANAQVAMKRKEVDVTSDGDGSAAIMIEETEEEHSPELTAGTYDRAGEEVYESFTGEEEEVEEAPPEEVRTNLNARRPATSSSGKPSKSQKRRRRRK